MPSDAELIDWIADNLESVETLDAPKGKHRVGIVWSNGKDGDGITRRTAKTMSSAFRAAVAAAMHEQKESE